MSAIASYLAQLSVGQPQTQGPLSLYPLIHSRPTPPDYITLDQALREKSVKVTEVSEGGSVPELFFVNAGEMGVFLLDGEELVGAKQNRILNLSVLVSGGSRVKIPVSCVEQGRWHYRSREFSTSKSSYFAKGRAKKIAQVSESLKARGERDGNQGQVWQEVSRLADYLDTSSSTEAMADIFAAKEAELQPYLQAFELVLNQVGALFVIHGQILGLDCFDSPPIFAMLLPKLVRGYAMEALATPIPAVTPQPNLGIQGFLAELQKAQVDTFPALGEGSDLRLKGQTLIGSALIARQRVIHLSAFPQDSMEQTRPTAPRRRPPETDDLEDFDLSDLLDLEEEL